MIDRDKDIDEESLQRVGLNDPLINSLKNLRFRLISPFLAILGLVSLITGALDFIGGKATFANNRTDDFLVVIGAFLLLLAVLMFFLSIAIRARWGNVQQARQAALRQPQRFLVRPQPVAANEAPQPGAIQWQGKRKFLISYFFTFYLLFSFILFYFVSNFTFTVKHLIVTLISAVLFASVMTVISTLSAKRTAKVDIQITQTGITTYLGATESSMKWEDARLFACYQERILWRTRSAVQYELVNEHTIVRWLQPKRLNLLQIEPAMDQQQFEQWQEQLRGYVVKKTGLPLVELKVEKKSS